MHSRVLSIYIYIYIYIYCVSRSCFFVYFCITYICNNKCKTSVYRILVLNSIVAENDLEKNVISV